MLALLSILLTTDVSGPGPKPEPPAAPAIHFVLLDSAGTTKIVTVQNLEGDTLATTDLDGRRRAEPLSRVIMISRAAIQPAQLPRLGANTEAPQAVTNGPSGVLHTVDGQVVAGQLVRDASEKDAVLWRSPQTGTMRVPLDVLKRLDCVYPPPALHNDFRVSMDTLFLRNGDLVQGFIDSISKSVRIEAGTGTDKQVVTLPLERVETIVLAQPLTPPKATMVALRGGLTVQLQSTRIHERSVQGELTLASNHEKLVVSDGDIETLVFDARRVQPLSLCTFHDVVAVNGRGWTQNVQFREMEKGGFASEIELPGPMQVDCDLPKGATRLLAHVELPHSCRTWGDPHLVLSSKQGNSFKELKRVKLSGDMPEADLNLELAGATQLRMSVEAGSAGPIQDRVVLKRALVLVEPGDKGTSPGKASTEPTIR